MMAIPPKKKGENLWACPQCGRDLPPCAESVASRILNEKHLPKCPKWLSSGKTSS